MSEQLASIIVPVYNCGVFVGEAIESVCRQTYPNVEIIVVDSSSDDTKKTLDRYRTRITYLHQKPRGVSAARNLGIQHARGEYIAFLDADDEWLPEKLSMQVSAFQRYSDAGLVFTDTLVFRDGEVIQESLGGKRLNSWCQANAPQIPDYYYGHLYRELLSRNCMNTSSVVVRRKVLEQAGMFDEMLEVIGEDYDLWLRIARSHPVIYIDRVLCKYRLRDDGLSGGQEVRSLRWVEAHTVVREKHLRCNWIPNQYRSVLNDVLSRNYWELGWDRFSQKRFREARTFFLKGLLYRPLHLKNWLYWCSSFLPPPIIEAVRYVKHRYKNVRTI